MQLPHTRRVTTSVGVLLVFACVLAPHALGQAVDLKIVGTWKLDLAKSKYNASPAPKLVNIHTWWWEGDSLKHKALRVDENGKTVAEAGHWSAKFDGKDHLEGGGEDNKISMKRIDAYTTEMTEATEGRPVQHFHQVVSKDGKTLTLTQRLEGQSGENVQVHTRQ